MTTNGFPSACIIQRAKIINEPFRRASACNNEAGAGALPSWAWIIARVTNEFGDNAPVARARARASASIRWQPAARASLVIQRGIKLWPFRGFAGFANRINRAPGEISPFVRARATRGQRKKKRGLLHAAARRWRTEKEGERGRASIGELTASLLLLRLSPRPSTADVKRVILFLALSLLPSVSIRLSLSCRV